MTKVIQISLLCFTKLERNVANRSLIAMVTGFKKYKKFITKRVIYSPSCLDKNYNIFQTMRFNHTMTFFNLID